MPRDVERCNVCCARRRPGAPRPTAICEVARGVPRIVSAPAAKQLAEIQVDTRWLDGPGAVTFSEGSLLGVADARTQAAWASISSQSSAPFCRSLWTAGCRSGRGELCSSRRPCCRRRCSWNKTKRRQAPGDVHHPGPGGGGAPRPAALARERRSYPAVGAHAMQCNAYERRSSPCMQTTPMHKALLLTKLAPN